MMDKRDVELDILKEIGTIGGGNAALCAALTARQA